MDKLDAIFVPVGGGGLVAGIAAYVKALKPSIKIIGVEPSGALEAGRKPGGGSRLERCGCGLPRCVHGRAACEGRYASGFRWRLATPGPALHAIARTLTHSSGTHTHPPTNGSAGANAMAQSLARGERVALSKVDAFAGGLRS